MSYLAAAAVLAAALIGAKGQRDVSKDQSFELERQAEEETISAEGRELSRRQRLNKILAANVVGQSVSGISGEGTPQSIALASAKQASISEGIESLSDRLKRAQLRRQASNVRSAGRLQATSTLLKSGFQGAQLS